MLARELISYRARLHRYFSRETLAGRLPVHRDTAYTSLAYNVGVGGAGGSTAVRRLNAGDIAGGCKAITRWDKAGNRVVRGLTMRRAEDYALCMFGVVA
jgi:GH24 family phage-related lysozyme (muramidase)